MSDFSSNSVPGAPRWCRPAPAGTRIPRSSEELGRALSGLSRGSRQSPCRHWLPEMACRRKVPGPGRAQRSPPVSANALRLPHHNFWPQPPEVRLRHALSAPPSNEDMTKHIELSIQDLLADDPTTWIGHLRNAKSAYGKPAPLEAAGLARRALTTA